MNCPNCNAENPADAQFCSSCGEPLRPKEEDPADRVEPAGGVQAGTGGQEQVPPAPPPTEPVSAAGVSGPPPGPPVGADTGTRLRRGWPTAVRWAFVPLAAAFALGLLLSVLSSGAQPFQFAPTPPGFEAFDPSALDVITSGLIGAYGYHHASFSVSLPPLELPDAPFPGGFDFSASGSFAPMLGTALVAFLLALGGRAIARAAPAGPWWSRLVEGAKIAVPYSILALAVSFAARQSFEFPELPESPFPPGGALTFSISPLSAFLWALVLSLVFGAIGGAWSDRDEVFRGAWGVRLRAMFAGAWRMTWVTLALSFVGLLVLAAVHSGGTRTYFEIAGQLGGTGGVWFVLTTIVALPNMATWLASGALGGSATSVTFFGSSCGLVSYFRFPVGVGEAPELAGGPEQFFADPCGALPIQFETAPIGYFLFLLIPIGAVLLGGMAAARRGRASTAGERAVLGAGAGGIFAVSFLGLAILSDLAIDLDVPFLELLGGGGFGFGPGLLSGFGLALVWGVAGGALGALLARRGASAPPAEERVAFEPA